MMNPAIAKALAAAASLLAVVATSSAQAGEFTCARMNQTEVAWTNFNTPLSVTNNSFQDIQGTGTTFTVGGSTTGCVVVSVSVLGAVSSTAPAGQILSIVAALDNGTIEPADFGLISIQTPQFAYSGNGNFSSNGSWDFIFTNVPAGTHQLKLQAAIALPFDGTNNGTINDISIVIRHR